MLISFSFFNFRERTMTRRNRFVSLILLILFLMPGIQASTWRIPATEVKYRLAENSPPGQILGTVAGPSPQKGVTNALGAPSRFFQLDPITSELSLKAEIDAEKLCALTTKRDDEKGGSLKFMRQYSMSLTRLIFIFLCFDVYAPLSFLILSPSRVDRRYLVWSSVFT